jgi:hypothetical protein
MMQFCAVQIDFAGDAFFEKGGKIAVRQRLPDPCFSMKNASEEAE